MQPIKWYLEDGLSQSCDTQALLKWVGFGWKQVMKIWWEYEINVPPTRICSNRKQHFNPWKLCSLFRWKYFPPFQWLLTHWHYEVCQINQPWCNEKDYGNFWGCFMGRKIISGMDGDIKLNWKNKYN
jgi:hypothetical protein